MEIGGVVTVMLETSPGVWEYTAELSDSDLQALTNVTSANLLKGSKRSTKLVSDGDGGLERHDVTSVTSVTYLDDTGAEQSVEFTSLSGYHQALPED